MAPGVRGRASPRLSPPTADHRLDAATERNIELYENYPQLALGGPTVAWIRAACEAAETVQDPEFMARIQIPIAVRRGRRRRGRLDAAPSSDYARRLRGGSMLTIDGARHEILQEADIYPRAVPCRLRRLRSRRRDRELMACSRSDQTALRLSPRVAASIAAACSSGVAAATMSPPFSAGPPSQSVTMPPAAR